MTTIIEHVASRIPAATGTIDYRSPYMTETPNAAFIVCSGDTSGANNITSHARMSVGFAQKTNGTITQNVIGAASENTGGASNANSYYNTSNVVNLTSADGTALDGRATVVDFLSNNGFGGGIRLNFTSLGAAGREARISVTLIYCPYAAVGSFSSPGVVGGTVTETLDFQPDTFMFLSTCCGSPIGEMELSFGCATADLTQRCQSIAESGAATSAVVFRNSDTRIMLNVNQTTGAIVSSQELTDITGTGFEVTQRDGTTSTVTLYLAMRLAPSRSKLVDITTITVGDSLYSLGWRPQYLINPSNNAAAFNTAYTDSTAGNFGINIFSANSFSYSPSIGYEPTSYHTGMCIQDNTATAHTRSVTSWYEPNTNPDHGGHSFTHIGGPSAYVKWAPSRAGFALNFVSSSANRQWWALAIQEDIDVLPPRTKRMYSLLHGLALSILATPSPLSAIQGFTRDDLGWRLNGYSHEIASDGGYVSAQISFSCNRDEAYSWIDTGVAKEITVYNEGQQMIWQGIVDGVSANVGPVALESGLLSEVITRLRVAYRTIRYDVINWGGQERETPAAEDENGVAFYGLLEEVINGGESADSEALQLRDSLLSELSRLQPTTTVAVGGSSQGSTVTLNCVGYSVLLDKYFYESTALGEVDASEKVKAVIVADPNAIFNTQDVEANTLQVGAQDDGTGKASTVIKGITSLGDANDSRFIHGGGYKRRYYYRAIPTSLDLILYLYDSGFKLRNSNGTIVHPWNATPGKWIVIPDISITRSLPVSQGQLDADPRSVFIERVSYTAPYGLQISGGRVNTINQQLAKRGLGGMG